jgi:hypothetical protein
MMRAVYLGDSYDVVKRFWSESLRLIAPLVAHSTFVPQALRVEYTALTSIPILYSRPNHPFGVLFDPDIGIPLPDKFMEGATVSYAPLLFIVRTNAELHPDYMICFDQSHHRRHKLSKEGQREAKREFLREKGILSFCYVSHAPFLFMSQSAETLAAIGDRLMSLGVPGCRFEPNAEGA